MPRKKPVRRESAAPRSPTESPPASSPVLISDNPSEDEDVNLQDVFDDADPAAHKSPSPPPYRPSSPGFADDDSIDRAISGTAQKSPVLAAVAGSQALAEGHQPEIGSEAQKSPARAADAGSRVLDYGHAPERESGARKSPAHDAVAGCQVPPEGSSPEDGNEAQRSPAHASAGTTEEGLRIELAKLRSQLATLEASKRTESSLSQFTGEFSKLATSDFFSVTANSGPAPSAGLSDAERELSTKNSEQKSVLLVEEGPRLPSATRKPPQKNKQTKGCLCQVSGL